RFCASSVSLPKSLHWTPPGGAGNCAQALRAAKAQTAKARQTTRQEADTSDSTRALFLKYPSPDPSPVPPPSFPHPPALARNPNALKNLVLNDPTPIKTC